MKILIINPNSEERTDEIIKEKVKKFAQARCEVDVVHLKGTPKLMLTMLDEAVALPELMEIVRQGEAYDAFIDACHSDPMLDVLKELTDKPVVGIAEASMKIASMNCNGFAVISPGAKSIPRKWSLAKKYDCLVKYRGAVACPQTDPESLYAAAKQAVEQYYVDGIVLGCANYACADAYIEQKLGIPVFDGIACAMILAAGLVEYQKYKTETAWEDEICWISF